jgi:beta-galactosidase
MCKGSALFVFSAVAILIFPMAIARADDSAAIPASSRITYDFDADWKFIRKDVPSAQSPQFDDSAWVNVSTPHTYNDIDTFNRIISHSSGQLGAYMGIAWYRKHFTIPPDLQGRKVFIEFEGMRQAGDIFLNGKEIGLYENGVNPYGIDITDNVNYGTENVLAVRVDNSTNYAEKSTHTVFEWEAKDFNPDYGGINRHVWLIATGPIHQTLPLYYGLETTGIYIYPSNISVPGRSLDLNIESQAANESGDQASIALSAIVADADGHIVAKFDGDTVDMVAGEKTILHATGHLDSARLWSTDDPYLYDVYTVLTVDNKVADVVRTRTGFRKAEFRGGAGTGGVFINEKFVYLRGFAQRSTNEWAGLGQAYPDWMHDLTAKLIHDSHANYLRWMHISPQPVDVAACDRFGIVEVCPAGDKEKDVTGRQWDQRIEVMRNSMIFYRNNPSIFFWEAGNNGISADHMKQMVDLKSQWDPNGGRVIGCRTLTDPDTTSIAEYYGVMIGQDPRTDALKTPDEMFRAYSAQRRDRAPLVETEDFRDEAARRFWDDYSPPHFGFKPGLNDVYHWNSETFSLAAAGRYWAYWSNRISNPDPKHSKWSGYASIYFSDSNADGRQDSSEVCRVSGKVDAVRLPKEAYFTYQVMQDDQPAIHILGHWTYPAGTKKSVYVISNCDAVELILNGQSLGKNDHPTNGYVFTFPNVAWSPGALKATGYKQAKPACDDSLTTAGPATSIKLTPILGPGGLRADGADVALFDVEVVDAQGRRCPTDEARIDFALTGPAIWRGGYNSGVINSTDNLYLNTECGINRISIRATRSPGNITLTASRDGLTPATAQVTSIPVSVTNGVAPE